MASTNTSIEWTDATWNCVTGCSKVSPGCAHCYAERLAPKVFAGQMTVEMKSRPEGGAYPVERKRQFTDVRCHEDRLDQPLRWRKPRRIFVNSMSDLFHEDVPDDFIDRAFAVMALAPRHTFQILTKRAERMQAYVQSRKYPNVVVHMMAILQNADSPHSTPDAGWPLPNVWLGVSVENQHFYDERIGKLLRTPAAVRFISYEPALGPLDLRMGGMSMPDYADLNPLPKLDWLIVGGESGPGARPFDLAWARSIVQQCQTAGVPVFVKQLGAKPITTYDNGAQVYDVPLRDRKGGDIDEWPADLRVRQFPG